MLRNKDLDLNPRPCTKKNNSESDRIKFTKLNKKL